MADFKVLATITADTAEQAQQVLTERLGFDEDYGFNYQIKQPTLISADNLADLRELFDNAETAAAGDSNDAEIEAWRSAAEYAAELLRFNR